MRRTTPRPCDRSILGILCLLPAFLLAGCPGTPPAGPAAGADRPVVVTSIYPLSDWVRQVAGDAVQVHTLLPAGASPHTFEPTPQDAERTARASLLLVVGLGLDDWARKLSAGAQTKTLVLGDQVQTMPNTNPDEPSEVGGPDPHVFTDPVRAAQMVAALTPDLAALVPARKAEIEQRSAAYQAQLQQFAQQAEQACQPYAGRQIVTLHAGFQYFLARVGLPPAEVVTPFPGKEPSAQYLEALALKARREHIKVVFAEPQLSPKAADVLAHEINGQVLILDYLGNPDDPTRDTYLKTLQFDLDELLKGLQAGA